MAFDFTVIRRTVFGSKRVVYGTFTNGALDTGGTINTGLHLCEHFDVQHTGASAVTESPSVNETLPTDGTVEIVCTANKNGLWFAVGL